MMFKMMAALAAVSATSGANAAPVYLTCSWNGEDQGKTIDLAIDESNQRITVGHPGDSVTNLPALFNPDEVRATERIGAESMYWVVNRVDLSLTTTVTFSSNVRKGVCKVKPSPDKRAF
jgi:hypothetical protein